SRQLFASSPCETAKCSTLGSRRLPKSGQRTMTRSSFAVLRIRRRWHLSLSRFCARQGSSLRAALRLADHPEGVNGLKSKALWGRGGSGSLSKLDLSTCSGLLFVDKHARLVI